MNLAVFSSAAANNIRKKKHEVSGGMKRLRDVTEESLNRA